MLGVRGVFTAAARQRRWLAAASDSEYLRLRAAKSAEIGALAEEVQHQKFAAALADGSVSAAGASVTSPPMTPDQVHTVLEAGMMTQLLHREARIASLLGRGFYTIGPCGEELLGVLGLHLNWDDPLALHYRHIAAQMVRQLRYKCPPDSAAESTVRASVRALLLDRARAYTVSSLDPVSSGMHCLIGGGAFDYPITSTLASQVCPAVGRALGGQLAHGLSKFQQQQQQQQVPEHERIVPAWSEQFVSVVSVGDGSVNNAHFLSGHNLAEYARFRKFKCPAVLVVSNNDICISLRGHNWLRDGFLPRVQLPTFLADGSSLYSSFVESRAAIDEARRTRKPVLLVFDNVPRRFGHAATDRQDAYLSAAEIAAAQQRNPLLDACRQAVADGYTSAAQLAASYARLADATVEAFAAASAEPRNDVVGRQQLVERCSAPVARQGYTVVNAAPPARAFVMRQFMTNVLDELLGSKPRMVYVGEDVEHGGYYLVTNGLAKKYPQRVRDFPPDETSLLGVGMGFAQAGLVPVVEIPYAKYLDCGADMFFEAALMRWLNNGAQPTGLLVRLQGFDKGVFGGNFHTHNALHLPPGVDVLCFSNGPDYARGFRTAYALVEQGRVVMVVDSTNLLNLRNLHDATDAAWSFPIAATELPYQLDDVFVYPPGCDRHVDDHSLAVVDKQLVIVSYGNGVVTALQARRRLEAELAVKITVVDTPCLSAVPAQLPPLLRDSAAVVFADVCKQGQNPYANFVTTLQARGQLPRRWQTAAACPTYNPLGSTITFLSVDDICSAAYSVMKMD